MLNQYSQQSTKFKNSLNELFVFNTQLVGKSCQNQIELCSGLFKDSVELVQQISKGAAGYEATSVYFQQTQEKVVETLEKNAAIFKESQEKTMAIFEQPPVAVVSDAKPAAPKKAVAKKAAPTKKSAPAPKVKAETTAKSVAKAPEKKAPAKPAAKTTAAKPVAAKKAPAKSATAKSAAATKAEPAKTIPKGTSVPKQAEIPAVKAATTETKK